MIYEIKDYTDGQVKITELMPTEGEFIPIYTTHVRVQLTPQVAAERNAQIEAEDVEDAFAKAPEAIKTATDEIKTEARQAAIREALATPGRIPNGDLRG